MSKINTNVNALTATNALTKNSRDMQLTMQRLSTGQRINGASDDAAGIAIVTNMSSQITGLNAAIKNANDGISMLQTADGALNETSSLVQRMRELAVLAINDTYSTTQKSAMNTEFTALAAQITSIATTTQWNGMTLLNGSGGDPGGTDASHQSQASCGRAAARPFHADRGGQQAHQQRSGQRERVRHQGAPGRLPVAETRCRKPQGPVSQVARFQLKAPTRISGGTSCMTQ